MALQKFAHGATHHCNFKRTALCENALHHDNKTIVNKKILCRFKKQFFSNIKKLTHTFSLQMFSTPIFSRFTSREHTKLHRLPFFPTYVHSYHSKAQPVIKNTMGKGHF